MSKKPRWTSDQIKNAGLVETDKGFVKSEKLVDKKPEKLSLVEQMNYYTEQLTDAQNKIKIMIKEEIAKTPKNIKKELPSLIDRAIPDITNTKRNEFYKKFIEPLDKKVAEMENKRTKDILNIKNNDNRYFHYEEEITKTLKSNPRVKNATKIEAYGIVFDSKLECYMYGLLDNAGIEFAHQKVFVVQDKFNYNGENIRAIKCVCDFWLPRQFMIIDSKGFSTDVSKLKYKMLKKHLLDKTLFKDIKYYVIPTIEMPKNKAECDILINKILYGN